MTASEILDVYAGLEPAEVWRHFAALNATPRPSGQEDAAAIYTRRMAEENGATWKSDPRGNTVIYLPATPGHEGAETVCLQAHLDMVCEKRWKVEEYHKSLKQNAALAKSPTKLPHTQQNHIFASLVAFVKLESCRLGTHLNHFALKAKLYQAAIATVLEQLKLLKHKCLNTSITP